MCGGVTAPFVSSARLLAVGLHGQFEFITVMNTRKISYYYNRAYNCSRCLIPLDIRVSIKSENWCVVV